jgi:hypothetical protein
MRKLDIAIEKHGNRYHWYAIDIEKKEATEEACCSISGKGSKCEGFESEQLAKRAGDSWVGKTQTQVQS